MKKTGKPESNSVKDNDEVFAEFTASELKCISDQNVKRLTKLHIQSLLFNGVTSMSTPLPQAAHSPWMGQGSPCILPAYSSPKPSMY